jgi:hypothetical protein
VTRETEDVALLAAKVGVMERVLNDHLEACSAANAALGQRLWAVCLIILGAIGSISVWYATQGQAIQQARIDAQTHTIVSAVVAKP